MKRMPILAIALVAAAFAAPWAAQALPARTGDDDALRVRIVLPVTFGSFDGCADGVSFAIKADDRKGTGTVCFLGTLPEFVPCNEGIGFCRGPFPTHWVLNLNRRGTIEADVSQREVITFFDPTTGFTTFVITFDGSVTGGTGKFRKLVGAHLSGGGPTSFDASGTQTGKLVVKIGEAPDKD